MLQGRIILLFSLGLRILTTGDQDFVKLLQEHHLSPAKWVPHFHNEGITTKALVTANEGSGELLEILSSNADTEDEKRGLRKLLATHEMAHSADTEIGSELSDAELKSLHIKETNDVTNIVAQSTVTNKVMQNSDPKQKVTSQAGAHKVAFQDLLKMVDLEKYYPQKLTPKDAVCNHQETLGSLQHTENPELLPYFIMQKIMMCSYKCRTHIFHHPQSDADTDFDSDNDDKEEEETDSENHQMTTYTVHDIHPMDGLLALIHCADNFLRQDLIVKLSTCKLAIPFLLPDPTAQTSTFLLWAMQSIVMEWRSKGEDRECRIVDYKAPIVSFLRFSESEMRNNI